MSQGEQFLPSDCLNKTAFLAALKKATAPKVLFKAYLKQLHQQLNRWFLDTLDAKRLIRTHSDHMDFLLKQAFYLHFDTQNHQESSQKLPVALVAVGGYGRSELHPHSDIDLLILLENSQALDSLTHSIQHFMLFLWDIKLNVGHSVRTIDECQTKAQQELTIMTNLLERRLLCGNNQVFDSLNDHIETTRLWPADVFFKAKWDEQQQRHTKHQTQEHNLEPSIKGAPGGLRDLQVIGWVCKRYFGTHTLNVLSDQGLLSAKECTSLENNRNFLWQIRFALHLLAQREQERLLFHLQRQIAKLLEFHNDGIALGVEHFMQRVYQTQRDVIELNDLIFLQFRENDHARHANPTITPLDKDFQLTNNALTFKHPELLPKHPQWLLSAFQRMCQHPNIQGMRSTTVRALRSFRHLIDQEFRSNPNYAQIFLNLLKSDNNVVRECQRMMRYGILGNYLPEFGKIIGRMQHDLLHVYTFDEQSLRTLRLLRAIRRGEEYQQFPLASRLIQKLPQKSVIYLAALLYNIGRAEEGPHDIKGARLVKRICKRHRIPRPEALLLTWLVRNQTLLSHSAQRENLMDPEIAHRLAIQIRDKLYLDYLYVFTVAQIASTNPKLWTGWQAQQMQQAYSAVSKALDYGLHTPADPKAWIKDKKQQAMRWLSIQEIDEQSAQRFWSTLDTRYFLELTAYNLAQQTQAVLTHLKDSPLIQLHEANELQQGASSIFVYTKDRPLLFATLTTALDQLNLVVVEAQLSTNLQGYALDTFIVLDQQHQSIEPHSMMKSRIIRHLQHTLAGPLDLKRPVQRRTPRRIKAFPVETIILITQDSNHAYDILEIHCADRPGLLAQIGGVMARFPIDIQSAKIVTEGERVEDIFFLRRNEAHSLTASLKQKLQKRLHQALNRFIQKQSEM